MDRSLLTKGRVEVSKPAESRRKVANMHGYAIHAIPRGEKVERIKSERKKEEKTNDERGQEEKEKRMFRATKRSTIYSHSSTEGPKLSEPLQKVYGIFTNDALIY